MIALNNKTTRGMSWRRARGTLAGVFAIAVAVSLLTTVPVASAQTADTPVAVDVDLVEGGVWVTYSDGCIESRAWQVPLDSDSSWYRAAGNRQCAVGKSLEGPDNLFQHPRIIRAPAVLAVNERVVALVPTQGGRGYWLVTSFGRVATGGAARSLGDLSGFALNAPVVAAAPTESGNGYYMLTEDGGVFTFGDARFYGSVQGLVDVHVGFGQLAVDHITAPVVTLATTPAGYWLVTADGTVFPFGDARYHGSIQDAINRNNRLVGITRSWVLKPQVAPGAQAARDALSAEVIGVVPSGGGSGYQMVAADGGIFNFGVSAFHGSLAGRGDSLAVASDVTDSRSGYVILTQEGTVYRFGVVGRQLDSVGRVATASTPTTLPAFECRPEGEQGLPVALEATVPIGSLDIGVLFVEFDDYRANRGLWRPQDLAEELRTAEHYLEAMSYGQLDVNFHTTYDWLSAGPLREEYWLDLGNRETSLGSDELLETILRRYEHLFDFSNGGLGYDGVMVVLPPSLFFGGLAWIQYPATASGVTVNAVAWSNTFLRDERLTERYSWWDTASHELLHLLGLWDLYAYDDGLEQKPDGWRSTEYGVMGFRTFWPARQQSGWNRGQIEPQSGTSFFDDYYTFSYQEALEMLAWHRWRLGWLEARQVACMAFGDATVDLGPVADPGGNLAMAVMKLDEDSLLVLERRERMGYDADQQGTFDNGNTYYYRELDDEGVLAYVVDVTVENGQLPVRLFVEGAELGRGDNWILGPGGWASSGFTDGRTLRIDVSDGPSGTSRVRITTS